MYIFIHISIYVPIYTYRYVCVVQTAHAAAQGNRYLLCLGIRKDSHHYPAPPSTETSKIPSKASHLSGAPLPKTSTEIQSPPAIRRPGACFSPRMNSPACENIPASHPPQSRASGFGMGCRDSCKETLQIPNLRPEHSNKRRRSTEPETLSFSRPASNTRFRARVGFPKP